MFSLRLSGLSRTAFLGNLRSVEESDWEEQASQGLKHIVL